MKKKIVYVPITPAGSACVWLEGKSKRAAIRNLMKDAAHMPYNGWSEFYERGYRIEEWEAE